MGQNNLTTRPSRCWALAEGRDFRLHAIGRFGQGLVAGFRQVVACIAAGLVGAQKLPYLPACPFGAGYFLRMPDADLSNGWFRIRTAFGNRVGW